MDDDAVDNAAGITARLDAIESKLDTALELLKTQTEPLNNMNSHVHFVNGVLARSRCIWAPLFGCSNLNMRLLFR